MNRSLTTLLQPRSIALVGASDRSPWSRGAFQNLRTVGYGGTLHLVNRRGGTAHGQSVANSCAAIGQPVDTALLLLPAEALADALADLAEAGIRNAVALAAGFAELGPAGAALQERLVSTARQLDIAFIGPNCMGFLNFANHAACWTGVLRTPPLQGCIAVVSQSGAIANSIAHFAHQQGVGLSCMVSTGNEASVDSSEIIDYLISHEPTKVIAVFAETFRNPRHFRAAAERALRAGKPLLALKVGRSEATAIAAQSHTGAMVGDDRVFDGACRQLGIVRVDSIEELVLTADLMSKVGTLSGDGIGIVSFSGGICELAADYAEDQGVELPRLSEKTAKALRGVLPAFATASNPLDITGASIRNQDLFEQTLRIMATEPAFSLIVCILEVPTGHNNDWADLYLNSVAAIGRAFNDSVIPAVLVSHTMKFVSDRSHELIKAARLSYVPAGCHMSVRAFRHAIVWSSMRRALPGRKIPSAHAGKEIAVPRSEREVLRHLEAFGVPVVPFVLVSDEREAIAAAARFDAPVALKISSPGIAHKSDVGGVILNLAGPEEVACGWRKVMEAVKNAQPGALLEGALVAPMRQGGIEFFVGIKRDPQWGHVIAIGLGGVWIEVLDDMSLGLLPLDEEEVRRMLSELRASRVMRGYRGSPLVDVDALAAVIVRIGNAALALGPTLATLEVNPLLVAHDRIEALDGLVTTLE